MSGVLHAIGDVSRATGLSVKALRLYQDKGLLAPSRVDASSGYRYSTERDIARARISRPLKDLQLSLEEIREVLAHLEVGASPAEQLAWARLFAHQRALGRTPRVPLRETFLRPAGEAAAARTHWRVELALGAS